MIATVHDPPDAPSTPSTQFTTGLTHWAQTVPSGVQVVVVRQAGQNRVPSESFEFKLATGFNWYF
jgi:hypothetical protein